MTANVAAPTYFMRLLGLTNTNVSTIGTASRRDVNVMMVLDRSGSMESAGACDDLIAASTSFVNLFANERDRIGMITYGGSFRVDYSPNLYFKSSSPTLTNVISGINCTGWTGTAQALWNGYVELAKLKEPGALNVILLFTDGIPNAITASFPVKTALTSTAPTGKSHCYDFSKGKPYTSAGWDPSKQRYTGWIAADSSGREGVYEKDAPPIPVTDDTTVLAKPTGFVGSLLNPVRSVDCYFRSNASDVHKDVPYYPDTDLYGNSMYGWKPISTYPSGPYAGKVRTDNGYSQNMNNAAINAVNDAGIRIRNRVLDSSISVVVYAIGLGGAGQAEHELLQRVSNDVASPIYDSTKPTGLYVFAPTAAELNQAFVRIASEVLRYSK